MERRDRQRGMALFVTLVVVMILYVVIYQLWSSAGLESNIARNQGGYMKSTLALRSTLAYAVALVQEDLLRDVESSGSSSSTEDLTKQYSGALGLTTTPNYSLSQRTPATTAGNTKGPEGATQGAAAQGETPKGLYDYINEVIFQPRTQTINDVTVKIEIIDGERRINLNKLFDYVALWASEEETITLSAARSP